MIINLQEPIYLYIADTLFIKPLKGFRKRIRINVPELKQNNLIMSLLSKNFNLEPLTELKVINKSGKKFGGSIRIRSLILILKSKERKLLFCHWKINDKKKVNRLRSMVCCVSEP